MKQELSTVAIDLAKKVFHLVGADTTGKILWRKRLTRNALMPFMAQLPPLLIGIEACGGAHYWARRFRTHGHDVKLLAPQFVKPFVKSNKNDMRDAEAIAEAVTRPTMRFVPIKEVDQQDIQALHRVRERLIGARTALINEVHGLMLEYGIVMPKGVAKFRQAVVEKLEADKDKLTALSQELFGKLVQEFVDLEKRVASYQEKLETLATTHPECQRLMTIPGIGAITATALVAAVGAVGVFKNGRQFAAWLGLVPKQHSTGGQTRLFGISKRGDSYVRKLLIHGEQECTNRVGLAESGWGLWRQCELKSGGQAPWRHR
jgi:transposase